MAGGSGATGPHPPTTWPAWPGGTPCGGGRRGCAFYAARPPRSAPERASRAGPTGFSRPAGRTAGRPEAPGPAPRARAGVALTHRPHPAPSLAHLAGVGAGAAPAGTRSAGFAKLAKGATPAGHAPSLAGAGSDTPAPRTRFKENSVGGEGGNKEKVKLGGGAAVSFCFPDLGLSGSQRRGASLVWALRPATGDLVPSPKGPVCSAPAGALPS